MSDGIDEIMHRSSAASTKDDEQFNLHLVKKRGSFSNGLGINCPFTSMVCISGSKHLRLGKQILGLKTTFGG